MTESEFLKQAEATLESVEKALESANNNDEIDVECERMGNVLEIELIKNKSKIIVNIQAPMQELWLAAKSGGFHYKYDGKVWRNTRDKSEFFSALSDAINAQSGAGTKLVLKA